MSNYAGITNPGTDSIDNILRQTAYQIPSIIEKETLNTEAWEALIPKAPLPTGVGSSLSSMVYNRSIPTVSVGGAVGVNWARVGGDIIAGNTFGVTEGQHIEGAAGEQIGQTVAARTAFVKFQTRMRNYFMSVANIKAPYIDVNTLREAASMAQQLSNMQELLTEVTKWTWARRHELEYERNCGNFVPCLTASVSPILTTVDIKTGAIDPETGAAATSGNQNNPFFGLNLTDLDLNTSGPSGASPTDVVPTGLLSHTVLDRIYNRLARTTSHADAYGKSDMGRPIFGLVLGSDISLALLRDTGVRDDVRKSSFVDELLRPLGTDGSFRGFYHMTQDLIPRYTESGGVLTRVEPFDADGEYNSAYDTASYEVAYVVHKTVTECQVPESSIATPGLTFAPVNYRGDFQWLNIPDEVKNPLQQIGFFYGTLASAYKPKKVFAGYTILFKRDSTTPAI